MSKRTSTNVIAESSEAKRAAIDPPSTGEYSVIDVRSDTVTKPSAEMRQAIAEAVVGDDVLERDPTMDKLETTVAEMLGQEAGLWVPTGCMGNTIALFLHLQRGDRFLAPAQAHVIGSELGTAAWLCQGMPEVIPWDTPGKITPEQVRKHAASGGAYYNLRTSLLCLENTHNFAGGNYYTVGEFQELVKVAKQFNLKVHLDGARLWHAAAAQGCTLKELSVGADTVNVCLSKGLGAPMGSVLCGSAELIAAARRVRKMLGGGVRQGGMMAAAGLKALEYLPRIPEDHLKASIIYRALLEHGNHAIQEPKTNILLIPVTSVPDAQAALLTVGVRTTAVGSSLRMITHRDLSMAEAQEVARRCCVLKPFFHVFSESK